MATALTPVLLKAAQDEYERLRVTLERTHPGHFVAIDPISKEYFIAPRLPDALRAAKNRYPDREFYSLKIGSSSAVTFSHL